MGRERLRADLASLASDSASAAKVAWLLGPEGVGKSTLAREACEDAGLSVHRVDVYPEDRDVPLAAVNELGAGLGIEPGDDPAQDLLSALESAGRCAVVIEDAQWMDDASQRALWQVVRRFRRLPVLLIVTSTDVPGTLLDGLGLLLRSPERGMTLKVNPLTAAEISTMLRRELGIPVEGETLEAVTRVTGGYSSLLAALVEHVRVGGPTATIRTAVQSLAATTQPSGLLRRIVDGAWATASDGERGAFLALAQTGELTVGQLTQVTQIRGLQGTDTTHLLATGLIETAGRDSLRLRHRHTARVIEEHATWAEVQQSHAALARVLTGLDALEHRIAAADDDATRSAVSIEVTDQLTRAYAGNDMELAFRLARHAARLDPRYMIEVVLAALRSGRQTPLLDVADDVDNMAPGIARTAAMTVVELPTSGVHAAAARLVSLASSQVADPRELVVVAAAAGQVAIQAGMDAATDAIRGFSALIAPLRSQADGVDDAFPGLAAELRLNASALEATLILLDDSVPALQRIDPLLMLRDRLSTDPVSAAVLQPLIRVMIGILRYVTGDLGEAKAELSITPSIPAATMRMQGDISLAHIAFLDGAWDEAHARADRHLASALDSLLSPMWPQAFAMAALVPAVRGECTVVEDYLGWQSRKQNESALGAATRRIVLAWGRVAMGTEPAETAELLDRAWPSVSYLSCFPTGVLRVRAHLAAGEVSCAAAAREDMDNEAYDEQTKAYCLAHADGLLAHEDGPSALDHFARAARHLRSQARSNLGATLKVYGFVLAEDWARAVLLNGTSPSSELIGLLDEAIASLGSNGAVSWRDRLLELANRVGTTPMETDAETSAALLAALTTREREVALLVADGLTNREIAHHLFVTVRTAEYHVHNALTKLGMTARSQLQAALGQGSASSAVGRARR